MHYLYRKAPTHKWNVSPAPPSGVLVHRLASETREIAAVRRDQLNAAIQAKRDEAKMKPRGEPGKLGKRPVGRPKGNPKVRVVLTVPPDIAALIPGNKNEYGNKAIKEKLKKDGLI